jgi:hypothetical protein
MSNTNSLKPSEWFQLGQQQAQKAQALQQQYHAASQQLTTSTTGMIFSGGGAGGSTTSTYPYYAAQGTYPATIDRLEKLEPGWQYIRWRKPEDREAEAWAVPIMALAIRGGHLDYVLGEGSPTTQPEKLIATTPQAFLGIIDPKTPYVADEWHEKARAVWYEVHAADVAARLLKGLAKV